MDLWRDKRWRTSLAIRVKNVLNDKLSNDVNGIIVSYLLFAYELDTQISLEQDEKFQQSDALIKETTNSMWKNLSSPQRISSCYQIQETIVQIQQCLDVFVNAWFNQCREKPIVVSHTNDCLTRSTACMVHFFNFVTDDLSKVDWTQFSPTLLIIVGAIRSTNGEHLCSRFMKANPWIVSLISKSQFTIVFGTFTINGRSEPQPRSWKRKRVPKIL